MAMTQPDGLAPRVAAVRAAMAAAADRVGRNPADIALLPVSKTRPADLVAEAARTSGLLLFGENRPQELAAKAAQLAGLGLGWVLIGPLQTNKAGLAAQWADQFQALDSLKVAQALDRRLQTIGRSLDVLIEVNTSNEASKHGVPPSQAAELARGLAVYTALRPIGLMTVAANTSDQKVVRGCFAQLRQVQTQLRDIGGSWDELSMGMSSDYQIAIEEGSTMVRIGQALFGPRASVSPAGGN